MIWPGKRRARDKNRRSEEVAEAMDQEADARLAETRRLADESRKVDAAKRRELDKNGWTELFAQALARRA